MKLKILFVTQEIMPYLPETYLSNISRYLTQGIQEKKKEIRTFSPKYGCINERKYQLHEVIRLSGMNIIMDNTDFSLSIKVASVQASRIQFYFIDNDKLFSRKAQFSQDGKEFEDNYIRSNFFTLGVLETIKKLNWKPDIIHCHGWFTALFPFYIKKIMLNEPLFADCPKIIYSVYNDQFITPLNNTLKEKLLKASVIDSPELENLNEINWQNITKFAISNSDAIIFAEQNIDENIKKIVIDSKKILLHNINLDNYVNVYNEFYEKIHANTF